MKSTVPHKAPSPKGKARNRAPAAAPERPSPPALMMLCGILEKQILCYPDMDSVTAEMESLRELIQHHPGLRPEVNALSKIIEGEAHFRELYAELAAI